MISTWSKHQKNPEDQVDDCAQNPDRIRVIAELGINHKGSSDVAHELIDIAAASRAWGVKFQYRNIDNFYHSTDQIGDEIISEEIERVKLTAQEVVDLAAYTRERGLRAGLSVFKASDIDDFGADAAVFDFFKVPSAELMNDEIFARYVEQKKLIIISTGGHTEEVILGRIAELQGDSVVFMHCIANYPVMTGNQQLAFIELMKRHVRGPVGYSSHDEDWEVCLLAMAEGAAYIERHLTLDKQGGGLDDSTSSDAAEFAKICNFAELYPVIRSSGPRVPNQGEFLNMQNLGTSLVATCDFAVGECVDESKLILCAPRNGLTKAEFSRLRDLPLREALRRGEPVTEFHYNKFYDGASADLTAFADRYDLSIPVRFHDCAELINRLGLRNLELHLSYGEVRRADTDWDTFDRLLPADKKYSIHLPDYLRGNRLIDPLSADAATREDSLQIIDGVRLITERLADKTGYAVPVVGSFSRESAENKDVSLDNIFGFLDSVRTDAFVVYPQWLPRIAWYFGGAEKLNMFCDGVDIAYIVKHKVPICLDVSHLILSANYESASWQDWLEQLAPFAGHIHLADAVGVDGEGIEFGAGDLRNIDRILEIPSRKVLEVWQGHLGKGYGFYEALKFLQAAYE
ncbi:MAG: N-acetylneuraminate synthase family protein [Alphaproteobacteria bacterium]